MTLKERLANQLHVIRGISEQVLSVFTTPQQWTHQVHEQANHALWFAGHMGTVDNFMLGLAAPEHVQEKPGYQEKFGMGSRPTSSVEDYPPVDEVLAFMRERREAVLEALAGLSDEDLAKPCPEGSPGFMTDTASAFEAIVWHEAMHAGQVTVARRQLGHPPIADAPPKG